MAVMLRVVTAIVLVALPGAVQSLSYWCPMHPNERATSAKPCPICKMTMVPIPPFRVGEYQMAVGAHPHPGGRGASGLTITLFNPDGRTPVNDLDVIHERPLHLFIVDRTLKFFAHVHPERAGAGRFELDVNLAAGEYMVVADFSPTGGAPQTLQRALVTPGSDASRAPVPAPGETPRRQTVSGVVVEASGDLTAAKTGTLTFSFGDAATGAPLRDLEPYLGSPAHLLVASADLTDVQHAHPEEAAEPSSKVTFEVTPASPGPYKLWLQFQRKGEVLTVPFVIRSKAP